MIGVQSATSTPEKPRKQPVSWIRVNLFGAGLGVLLLALCAAPVLHYFLARMGGTAVMGSISAEAEIAFPLLLRICVFVGTALLLHAGLGLLATAMTWLVERRHPAQSRARLGITFLWLALLFMWVLVLNAAWFPRSSLGEPHADLATMSVGPLQLHAIVSVLVVALVAWFAIRGALPALRTFGARRAAFAAVLLIVAVALTGFMTRESSTPAADPARPNVILIGADSLRLDELAMNGGMGNTPVLDGLLRQAHVFTDTTTPIARTFPSWVAILTGRHPRSTGAKFNLISRDTVDIAPTLADALRARGYRTVFATDEVRFSNIDESYGFDDVVTPVIGASDFVLGSVADLPLLNVLNATAAGTFLFPDTHANRAAATIYRPEDFSRRLADEIDIEAPTLLAVHFTTSHWPYHWADAPHQPPAGDKATFAEYRASLRAVDAQVGELLARLRAQGALGNAIVVILSDHGEAMLRPGDSIIRKADPETTRRLVANEWGHGTSVLSPVQYQVLLGFVGFGAQESAISTGVSAAPASLEDVVPTIFGLLDIPVSRVDGLSLAPELNGKVADAHTRGRIRFTETDFTLPRMLAGDLNVKQMAEAAVAYYRVNPVSGWVEIRQERLDAMMKYKERAAIWKDWLLAAVPATQGTLYGLVNRQSGEARIVNKVPALSDTDPASILFEALQQRFPGELELPPAAVASPPPRDLAVPAHQS